MSNFLENRLSAFVEEHGYIPSVFCPYNCTDVSELAPTVLASCGGSTTIGALYKIDYRGEKMRDIKLVGKLDIKGHDICRRVYGTDGISLALNCCEGGNLQTKILNEDNLSVRKLTPTEYGRLQAFPMDKWKQVVSDSQTYKQFGNAVTTTVVTAIAESIKKTLDAS